MSVDDVREIAESKAAISKALNQIVEILDTLEHDHGADAVSEVCTALEAGQ